MGFRRFLILYIALVTTPSILLFLCSIGITFQILQFFLTFIVSISIMIVGLIIATRLSAKVTKATLEELQREDDVLLQAVGFSQSVLFIVLSLMPSEDKLQWSFLIAIVTITFYALRAWAKIKNSPKYRYYSMIAFAFVSSNSVTSVLKLSFDIPNESIVSMSTIYSSIAIASAFIAEKVFRKRYGYRGSLFRS